MANIEEILAKAKDVHPIAEREGRQIMSFDDQRSLATVANMNGEDLGGLKFNPDGTLARTKGNTAAVNVDNYYKNRYKKIKNKYYVVCGKSGRIHIDDVANGRALPPQIEGYLIGERDGEVVCEKKVIISDKDFLADYTHTLDHASMKLVLNAIEKYAVEPATDSLTF